MKTTNDAQYETNRNTWNEKVAVHVVSEFYDVEGFKKGNSSLNQLEIDALGDVSGKSLLHLQCHFGQDTLSWARAGAICTGVDLSDAGIAYARKLASDVEVNATFVACNVYDVPEHISETYDIVYTSYGVIGWLPDLKKWAQIIADRLKSGGTFYMVEFHPIVWMFDYEAAKPTLRYAYNQKELVYEEYQGTYAQQDAAITSKEYTWNHGLGEVISSLAEAGLRIDYVREHDESPYDIFPELVKNENGLYVTKDRLYPLLYDIKATKP